MAGRARALRAWTARLARMCWCSCAVWYVVIDMRTGSLTTDCSCVAGWCCWESALRGWCNVGNACTERVPQAAPHQQYPVGYDPRIQRRGKTSSVATHVRSIFACSYTSWHSPMIGRATTDSKQRFGGSTVSPSRRPPLRTSSNPATSDAAFAPTRRCGSECAASCCDVDWREGSWHAARPSPQQTTTANKETAASLTPSLAQRREHCPTVPRLLRARPPSLNQPGLFCRCRSS